MIYYILDRKLIREEELPSDISAETLPCLCIMDPEEFMKKSAYFQLNERVAKECAFPHTSKFESHEDFDFISLLIPLSEDPVNRLYNVSIVFRQGLLIFVCENPQEIRAFQSFFSCLSIAEDEPRNLSLARIVQMFFDYLTNEDSLILEAIEEETSKLEETLIMTKKGDFPKEIITLRKKLLAYKRYYDLLSSISASIEENENGLFTDKEVRYFRILTNRTERLLSEIGNLRDYVSQIREAYQTQIDINQNSIMKLFTVITVIFMPPTLIVGWYGMNFGMPELKTAWGYPAVAVIVITVTLMSALYLKKHKWF